MHIGVSLSPFGHHPAAWREQDAALGALAVGNFIAQARKAEGAALDFVLLADAQACRPLAELSPQAVPFEPTTLVAALATLARRIGFVATAATGQHELYNLARRFASLDSISGGRVGWNLLASGPPSGPWSGPPAATAVQWNAEYIAVVGGLWDSWDDDAFVYDKAAGRFFVPEKMHVLDHRGKHFTVRGPLNVNRSPQGRPIIAQTLTRASMPTAAQAAEVVFLTGKSRAEMGVLLTDLQRLLDAGTRRRSDLRVLVTVVPWIGGSHAEAREVCEELNARALPGAERPSGCDVIGTPIEVADALQEWFEQGDVDGFVILPPVVPRGLDSFVDSVVPELCRRRLLRTAYEGTTLRDHLGLERPWLPATVGARAS